MIVLSYSLFAQEESTPSAGQTQSGLVLKGGLWGLAGKAKTELEDKYFGFEIQKSGFKPRIPNGVRAILSNPKIPIA